MFDVYKGGSTIAKSHFTSMKIIKIKLPHTANRAKRVLIVLKYHSGDHIKGGNNNWWKRINESDTWKRTAVNFLLAAYGQLRRN